MLELLASRGANLNSRTHAGVTLAHIAARGGDADCLAVLCERGADVDAVNQSGNTPIMFAALTGSIDVSFVFAALFFCLLCMYVCVSFNVFLCLG